MASQLKALDGLKSFNLPLIATQLPLQCHPNNLSLSRRADEWILDRLRVTDSAKRKMMVESKLPLYNSLIIPQGKDEDSLVCCKYCWISTTLDDRIDDEIVDEITSANEVQRFLADVTSILEGVSSRDVITNAYGEADARIIQAWDEVVCTMRKRMMPAVYQRWVFAHQEWATKSLTRDEAATYNFETYSEFRSGNVLFAEMMAMLEMCYKVTIDDKDLESLDYIACKKAMLDSVWMVNDLMSIRKDLWDKNLRNRNLLCVLLLSDPNVLTFQDAVDKTCSLIQAREEEFIYYNDIAIRKAKESGKLDFVRYLKGLRATIPGNLLHHSIIPRYHGVDNPFLTGEVLHGTWVLHPKWTIIV